MLANFFSLRDAIRVAAGLLLLLHFASVAVSDDLSAAAECNGKVSTPAASWGTFRGKIVFRGTVPDLPPLVRKGDRKATDAKVCAAHDVPDESLVIDPKSRGISNVFVYLRRKPKKIHPELSQPRKTAAVLDQKGCHFIPHALAVRAGQTVLLKSSDPVLHNTNIVGYKNVLLAAGGEPETFQFKEASLVPVPVECNLHPWMKAWLMAFDHPYFAVTGKAGEFQIEKLPTGTMEFRFWQERVGYLNDVNGKLKKGVLQVTIEPGKTTDVTIVLDAKALQLDKKPK